MTSTVLWQVCSRPRWYLFKQLERRLEMTSWHETYHRWQVWQAAKLQVGGGGLLGQAMSGDQTHLVSWKILGILSSCCRSATVIFSQSKSYEIHDSGSFLRDLSEEWSREIKFHWPARTWSPLSPRSLSQLLSTHSALFPGVDGLWLHGRKLTLFIIHIHYVSVLSVCTAPRLGVQRFSRAQSHPLFWRIL